MGQPVHLMLFAYTDDHGYEAAARALAELRRVEARLSLFDSASDLSELNRLAGKKPLAVDDDLHSVLMASGRFRIQSAGAFNVAVEPLMRVWGFHTPRSSAPSEGEIREAREASEVAVISLDDAKAFLPSSHTQLDFGGIGVGYGLDRMAVVLRGSGIGQAFIDISGDCLAIGAPAGAEGWPVAIVDPCHPGRTLREVRLRDQALATSANTESVVHYGRIIRGHVMDPATGYPANRKIQATAIARNGLMADALSTAMLVSGRELAGVEQAVFA